MGVIEALYIFDEHNNTILEHIYTGRPPSADVVLPEYLAHSSPRPSLIYLPNTSPPVLLFSIVQDRLLFFCLTTSETEPLLVLEFLHRVADALEEFLGAPLLASKLEASYDVVVQIAGEMCDAGLVASTEPNALRDVVEAPTWMGSFFGGLGLPSSSPSLSLNSGSALQGGSGSQFLPGAGSNASSSSASTASAIPWRRSNVRHTSNELYVDVVEQLSVILAPSGRPLSALVNGTIAFTAKISGVPELLLTLSCPGGKHGISHAMDLPTFHPCVRLNRWREKPGELSFVPPDGRFVLAGYECNLMPDVFTSHASSGKLTAPMPDIPASIEVRTLQGSYCEEFEVVFSRSQPSQSSTSNSSRSGMGSRTGSGTGRLGGTASPAFTSNASGGGSGGPPLEQVVITVPIPEHARNVTDIKSNKGEANYLPADGIVEWRIPGKEASMIGPSGATMRCTVVGPLDEESTETETNGLRLRTDTYDYDENEEENAYQSTNGNGASGSQLARNVSDTRDARRIKQSKSLMPRSATLSFSVRGWLASGIKVDSLTVNTKTSKGLGAGVTPYKGVKYHTVSRDGIEVRC